ncbi:hypothetical protein [uncultured Metabacillus sp.]|uniref:hypothetical protein n=1 Tax=uncultured Metabacillus sp. TaxID=2860135 RepID=UPI00261E3948|nr:hypothetical protein [uncultured Metabacillus sp.]
MAYKKSSRSQNFTVTNIYFAPGYSNAGTTPISISEINKSKSEIASINTSEIKSKNKIETVSTSTSTNNSKMDSIDMLLAGKKERSKKIYRGFYFDEDILNIIDRTPKNHKSELVNEALRKVFKDKGLLNNNNTKHPDTSLVTPTETSSRRPRSQ